MIIKAEKTAVKSGYPGMNRSKIGMIRSIAITDQSFSFASESAFEDQEEWFNGLKADEIVHLADLKEITNDSRLAEYQTSLQDYQYPGRPGKYMYTFKAIWKKEFQDHIINISGQDKRAFICDINKNVHANLNGSQVRGLDIEMINIEPEKLPGENSPAWAIIKLVLSDVNEHNLVTCMDWNPNRFNLVHVAITDVSGAANYIDFTINDSVYGRPIDYLYVHDLSIVDNAGGIIPVILTEKSCGQYRVIASGTLSYGTLTANSDRFYGSADYYINEDTVSLSDYAWESRTKFQADVRFAGSGGLYTGLLLADFTLADDLLGSVVISSVSEVSAGRYEFIVASNLTEGDISVNDGTVTGSTPFDVEIAVTIDNFSTLTSLETQYVICDIYNTITLAAVTGLDTTDFTLQDDYNGVISVLAVTETSPGTYQLQVDAARTSGILYVNDIYYVGNGAYSYSTVTVINGGASNTTDFINATAGLAERFTLENASNCTPSIQTGQTGFTGNVQRLVMNSGSLPVGIRVRASYFKTGVNYILRVKFSTASAGTGPDRFVTVQIAGVTATYISEQHENTSAYFDIIETTTFQPNAGEDYLTIAFTFNRVGMYIQIDELEFIEV